MDSFTQCYYCKKNLTSPLELICKHSYCSDCLTKEIQNDKIMCPVCDTEHTAPASSLSSATQDKLSPYLIGLSSGAPYAVITDDSPATIQAECAGCKKTTDLRTCFHCEKPLCADCRTKHYESQKKDVDQSVQSLHTKTGDLITLARELNNSRTHRIQEYHTLKEHISTHVKDLTKQIHDEEQVLQKKIDARIQFETEKISVTEREQEYLQKNKLALDNVADIYRNENNQMILIKMHKDYLDTAPIWKGNLETHAGRLNPKNEEELHFHSSQKNDAIVGTLTDSKHVNIHAPSGAKRMAKDNDPTKSRSCTIM